MATVGYNSASSLGGGGGDPFLTTNKCSLLNTGNFPSHLSPNPGLVAATCWLSFWAFYTVCRRVGVESFQVFGMELLIRSDEFDCNNNISRQNRTHHRGHNMSAGSNVHLNVPLADYIIMYSKLSSKCNERAMSVHSALCSASSAFVVSSPCCCCCCCCSS